MGRVSTRNREPLHLPYARRSVELSQLRRRVRNNNPIRRPSRSAGRALVDSRCPASERSVAECSGRPRLRSDCIPLEIMGGSGRGVHETVALRDVLQPAALERQHLPAKGCGGATIPTPKRAVASAARMSRALLVHGRPRSRCEGRCGGKASPPWTRAAARRKARAYR